MKASNFILEDYLRRINYTGEISVDRTTLFKMIKHQLRSVPFENITVQEGRVPSLVPEDIVAKIVPTPRGGYCYEVNGLLAMALEKIGFSYYFVAARVLTYKERRPRTHMALLVQADGEDWLCDVGFGGYGLREPISLQDFGQANQDGELYHLKADGRGEYILNYLSKEGWKELYSFFAQEQEWIEFTLANYYNAKHPDTIFTQKKLAILQTEKGRKIAVDDQMQLIENGTTNEFQIPYKEALEKYFGIRDA